ncbi:MAG: septum site-determining protein MinD [Clostridia bacterium]|nr:septum site-determining protein MinD [Clostridia bacterium]
MARSIVVTSGKGGVGKTTLTANLGRALAEMGLRVVLMDTDIGLNNLDVLMDVENRITFDLIDVIENRCRPRQALIADTEAKGLFVMPSAHSYDTAKINGQNIRAVIRALEASFDYVLVDCPAGIELGFHRAVAACNEGLVVVTPHISSIKDADKVLRLLKSYGLKADVVVNRARGDLILSAEMVDVADVEQLLKLAPIGMIPEDDDMNLSGNFGVNRSIGSEGYDAIRLLAANIHLGTRQIYDVTKKYRGFFGGLKRGLRRIV